MSNTHAVVIVGGGPTGLMLAGELALARVDVAVVERRETRALAGSRAGGLHARTLEVLAQRGIAERFVAQGQRHPMAFFGHNHLTLGDCPTRFNFTLGLWQQKTETTLAAWVSELSVPMYLGCDATDVVQDANGVDVGLSDGRSLRAQYVVGCDGGRSMVRKQAGIDFAGSDAETSYLIAELEMTDPPAEGLHRDARGFFGVGKLDGGPRYRIVLEEREVHRGDEPTLAELRDELIAIYGTDHGVHSPTWLSRFTDAFRQAATYRAGRVLVAGDAAHVHSPVSGQGLNLGVQDAVNLGWKLAQVVHGTVPDSLLDTYHAERHPVGARVLRFVMGQVALDRRDVRTEALKEMVGDMMKLDEPRKRFAARAVGLDIHYDLGAGHPQLGRRVPDLDVITADGPARVFTFLHDARPVLLNLGAPLDLAPWADRVRRVDAHFTGAWELPVLGVVPTPAAVLIRPDGHVAWVGDGTDHGLADALTAWFGPAR